MRKMITCKECGEVKPHGAFGLCKKWDKYRQSDKIISECNIVKGDIYE